MKSKLILTLLFLAFGQPQAYGALLTVSGDSEFTAIGKPSAIKIHGQGQGGLTGSLNVNGKTVDGNVKFALTRLETGIELRDKHMKEKYLETEKFPEATLAVDKMQMKTDPQAEGFKMEGVTFTGQLTLHGVTRPIKGAIDLRTTDGTTQGDGKFTLNLSDYKVDIPKYLGITVADTVEIEVHLKAKKN